MEQCRCPLTLVCFDIVCITLLSTNCETSSAWREFRYENIQIIMLFLVGVSGIWGPLLSGKPRENILSMHPFTCVIHLSGTKSMPARIWQCATMTYLRWRTITALWPSRSFLFLSAISLQMWILRHSNRSDRWDMHVKLSLWQACWVWC